MIEVRANGKTIRGFSSVNVSRALSSFCATYSLGVFKSVSEDSSESAWIPVFPGDKVEIFIDGELVVVGYNDESSPSFSGNDYGCSIKGREITCDMVDCVPERLNYDNKKVDEICRLLCNEFSLRFDGCGSADVGKPFKSFSADPGQKAYEVAVNACKERRVVMMSDGCGHVRIDGGKYSRASVDIVQGGNVLQASANFSVKDRYSEYKVVAAKDFKGKTFAVVEDEEMERPRKWLLLDEKWATKDCCESRAMWEAKHRQCQASKLSVVVPGWHQMDGGPLWSPGLLVSCDLPAVLGDGLQDFLVDRVSFSFSPSDGCRTSLTLVDPDVYAPSPSYPVAKKKAKATKKKSDPWATVRRQTGSTLK